mmetsp:Transcript_85/g.145  ORF Transcript_85/g.145 Transcript_85/m.145 type:complete len:100 (+) Transcript_85:75-374(+)
MLCSLECGSGKRENENTLDCWNFHVNTVLKSSSALSHDTNTETTSDEPRKSVISLTHRANQQQTSRETLEARWTRMRPNAAAECAGFVVRQERNAGGFH